ncbi:amidohydrolase family protein [Arthrobacter sp. efr-133-TYG-118]|uniref:amidohydrolase family protein n=1 Tax=Arthrobacter sp. efr-133-TYG-118 TaxID=3040279 RepID=UPI00254D0667|nr:amidohydrolase family protein [Arthrobacter sp. efr-133-TYG-118]
MNRFSDAQNEARMSRGAANRDILKAIDVHTHYVPQGYRDALARAGITHPDGFHGGIPAWSDEAQLAQMDRFGIETAIVSLSTPGVRLAGVDTAAVARSANEAGAGLAATYPGRFGFLAALPVPDVEASLAEIAYAFDEFGAWGVSLLTHTEGVYLGDPRLEPIMEELGRRNARLLIHPTEPAVVVPGVMNEWSRSMYEFFFDSTRAITNLIFSGTLSRHPGIRVIIPHAGAAIPALAQRIERNVWRANSGLSYDAERIPGYIETLERCYFDLAGSVLPHQIASLQALVPDTNIVYGSDFPFTNTPMGAELNADLRGTDLLTSDQKRAYLRDNAIRLFPQLSDYQTPACTQEKKTDALNA